MATAPSMGQTMHGQTQVVSWADDSRSSARTVDPAVRGFTIKLWLITKGFWNLIGFVTKPMLMTGSAMMQLEGPPTKRAKWGTQDEEENQEDDKEDSFEPSREMDDEDFASLLEIPDWAQTNLEEPFKTMKKTVENPIIIIIDDDEEEETSGVPSSAPAEHPSSAPAEHPKTAPAEHPKTAPAEHPKTTPAEDPKTANSIAGDSDGAPQPMSLLKHLIEHWPSNVTPVVQQTKQSANQANLEERPQQLQRGAYTVHHHPGVNRFPGTACQGAPVAYNQPGSQNALMPGANGFQGMQSQYGVEPGMNGLCRTKCQGTPIGYNPPTSQHAVTPGMNGLCGTDHGAQDGVRTAGQEFGRARMNTTGKITAYNNTQITNIAVPYNQLQYWCQANREQETVSQSRIDNYTAGAMLTKQLRKQQQVMGLMGRLSADCKNKILSHLPHFIEHLSARDKDKILVRMPELLSWCIKESKNW